MDSQARTIKITKPQPTDGSDSHPEPWLILVIDDVQSVLDVTRNVLKHLQFNGRGVRIECARSTQEAKQLYLRNPDPAVVLVDCVMEQNTAGLELIEFIRNKQNNQYVQIVMRTGQPGIAPEQQVLEEYQINDYLAKTELSSTKLRNKIIAYLRNYETIKKVAAQNGEPQQPAYVKEDYALAGSIAHEIRSPLSQINLNLNRIRQSLPKLASTEQSSTAMDALYRHIDNGQYAVKYGQKMIEFMLDEVKNKAIDSDDFTYLSARQLTQRAVASYGFQSEAEIGRVVIEEGDDFMLWLDETRYSSVLFNLLKNALYYLSAYPDLIVTVSLQAGTESHTVKVRDTGPGIAPEKLEQLFDSFYTSDKISGTGLGLSYCKRVMNAFNGSIHCQSKKEAFTEFVLSFPVTLPSDVSTNEKLDVEPTLLPSSQEQLSGKTLLVIDDEAINRKIIIEFLDGTGVNIVEASSGETAFSVLEEVHCDLIMTDLNMPIMNGVELTRVVRIGEPFTSFERYPLIPIVVISGDQRDELIRSCFEAGANAFVGKPVEKATLINTLVQQLNFNTDLLPS